MARSDWPRVMRVAVLVSGLAIPAAAQDVPFWTGPERPLRPLVGSNNVNVTGTLKAMAGNILHLTNEQGGQCFVMLPAEPFQVNLTATASPQWLQLGMNVRFVGRFDAKGAAVEPIRRLETFVVRPPRPGDVPPVPGVYPEIPAVAPGQAEGPQPPAGTGLFRIVGTLAGMKDREIAVAAGVTMVRVQLAADVTVTVQLADARWARAGDTVEVRGWCYDRRPGQVYANHVTIRAAQPLALPAQFLRPPAGEAKPGEEAKPAGDAKPKPEPKPKEPAKEKLPF